MKHWLDIFPLFPRRDALVKCKQLNTTERLKLKLSVCIKFSVNAKSRGLGVPRGLKWEPKSKAGGILEICPPTHTLKLWWCNGKYGGIIQDIM